MKRPTLLLLICVGFLAGVGLAVLNWRVPVWSALIVATAALVLRRRKFWLIGLLVLFGLILGLWRGAWYGNKLAIYKSLWKHNVTVLVRASDDGLYAAHSQLSFTATQAQTIAGQPLTGSLVISGFGVNSVMQGDLLEVSGKLTPGLGAEQARLSYAKIKLLSRQPSLIAGFRRKFTAAVLSALPEPQASFAMGLLIGQRASLPANVKQDLLMVGLTHIIAVSGYNLTIIMQACRRLLAKQSKRLTALVSLGLLSSFLLVAGNSASIVRAAIVSLLSMTAAYYGRDLPPLLLLSAAASITAWARPAYVWRDASWYLSFLAFFGVMIVAPSLAAKLPERWRRSVVCSVALESVSAELLCLPYILHEFGQMSFVGLPANILVTVFVPLAMLLSLVAGLAAMLAGNLSGWLAWPAHWLLTYMLQVARWLASWPHVFVQNLAFSTAQMVGCYLVVAALSFMLWHKTKALKYVKLTDEFGFRKEPN